MIDNRNEDITIWNFKDVVKPLAFMLISDDMLPKNKFDDVINKSLNIEEESIQYAEIGEIIEREFKIDARENSPIKMLTQNIVSTFKKCRSDYKFEVNMLPRRELTNPSEGVYNDGRDNIEFNLIVSVHDEIKGPHYTYQILDIIGQGISGQVFKCLRKEDEKMYAIKIIKNKKAYNNQALIELKILEFLNQEVDKEDLHHIIRLFDHFYYREHLCIIFELLNENLYELLKQNYFQGISLNSIQFIIKQILEAVYQLQKANLIHCDLKPENVLLKIDKENHKNDIIIKITDFGSSCFKNNTMFEYIQSRYYRAPEVLISSKYSCEIDIWSIGCIAVELFLGEPLFPGSCEYDQIAKIVKLQGMLPGCVLRNGKKSRKFFKKDEYTKQCRLKTAEEYYKEFPNDPEVKYEIPFDIKNLDDLAYIKKNRNNLNLSQSFDDINNQMESFINFLKGLLTVDPSLRWNAKQALRHPFISKERFTGFYNPNADEISQMVFHSIDTSHMSDHYMYNRNYNMNYNTGLCQSMRYNPQFNQYTIDDSSYSCEYDGDVSVFQANMNNLPLKLLKNFPFAKINEINFKPNFKKNPNNRRPNLNNTFMKTSHDGLFSNNSFTSDKHYYGPHRRKFKDDNFSNKKFINKYSQLLSSSNLHYNFDNNLMNSSHYLPPKKTVSSNLHVNFDPNLHFNNINLNDSNDRRTMNDLSRQNLNKSLFSKDKSGYKDSREYEGLLSMNKDSNRSFDYHHNRTRSKSEYYNQQNFLCKNSLSNNCNIMNNSNCSTNEKENYNFMKGYNKNLSSQETPIVTTKIFSKADDKDNHMQIHCEVKEEDQGDEEVILSLNKY